MKCILKKIAEFFTRREEIAEANRYIDYADNEIAYLREALDKSVSEVAKMVQEKINLSRNVDVLVNTANKLRNRVLSHGCTPLEMDFLLSCEDIYSNGKMISRMRFEGMVGAMIDERNRAIINRQDIGDDEGGRPQGAYRQYTGRTAAQTNAPH